jgi:hypothetical protein
MKSDVTAPSRDYDKAAGSSGDHVITDLKSFERVTAHPRELAALYYYQVLDCLVDLAHNVAEDFFARPELYVELEPARNKRDPSKGLDEGILGQLARLHARYGSDEYVPSKAQRDAMYAPLFGQTAEAAAVAPLAGPGQLGKLRNDIMAASAEFTQRIWDTSEGILRAAVNTSHWQLKKWLIGVQGDSIRWSRSYALPGITDRMAYPILRNRGVASVFGIASGEIDPAWPYALDENADKVIENISTYFCAKESRDKPAMLLRRESIGNRQRVALRGAEAIAAILDYDERDSEEQQDRLIRKCYVWATALQAQAASDVGTAALPIRENGRVFTGNPALPAYASGSELATFPNGMRA